MKKIIALLLAVLCMVSMFACGEEDDPVLLDLQNVVFKSMAESGKATIEITDTLGDVKTFESELFDSGDEENTSYLKIPNYLYASVDSKGNITMPEDMSESITGNPGSKSEVVNLAGLTFNSEFFKDETYTYQDNKFKATIIDSTGFFGVELTKGEVKVEFTIKNNMPNKGKITYTTDSGLDVEITLKYDY